MHLMHFNQRLSFFYYHESIFDTIFNISWQIFIMKSKKVIKCHFDSALKCRYKCWLLGHLLTTFHLKRLTNCVNAICFLMGCIYFRSESVCHLIVTRWWRALEKFSWVLSLLQIACWDWARESLAMDKLTDNTTIVANRNKHLVNDRKWFASSVYKKILIFKK